MKEMIGNFEGAMFVGCSLQRRLTLRKLFF